MYKHRHHVYILSIGKVCIYGNEKNKIFIRHTISNKILYDVRISILYLQFKNQLFSKLFTVSIMAVSIAMASSWELQSTLHAM